MEDNKNYDEYFVNTYMELQKRNTRFTLTLALKILAVIVGVCFIGIGLLVLFLKLFIL